MYQVSQAFALMKNYGTIISLHQGNMFMFLVIYLMEMNVSNSGNVFEDLIFKDMNYANLNIIKNQYIPNTLCTFVIFF